MKQDRRRFLGTLASAGAGWVGAPLVLGCGDDSGQGDGASQPEATSSGDGLNLSELELGVPRTLDEPVVVVLDDRGVYAMTTLCTHAQCDMSRDGTIASDGLSCGCHGSRFDIDGTVTAGPAQSPLPHFAVTIAADGTIVVDADQVVSADRRAPAASG